MVRGLKDQQGGQYGWRAVNNEREEGEEFTKVEQSDQMGPGTIAKAIPVALNTLGHTGGNQQRSDMIWLCLKTIILGPLEE